MKTVQQEYCVYVGDEEEETTLPITMCETVEDVLSLDATVDKERLRRAIAHPLDDTTIEADWADDLANDPEGEGILRPDEMVFLDKGLNSWFVKGSGMCYGYDGCCMEDLIPYLYNKPRRENDLLYTDRNNDLWVMERPVLTPVADRECCLAVADPFIDINKTCDGMFFHRKDKTSPDFYLFGFSLAQYQHVLRCHAPLTQIEVEAHPMSYDEWLNS
jgi:hypothetical protein